jgi:beta-N-acetylhexosaminidase
VLVLGVEGIRLAAAERRILARVRPAGVILVQRNVADLETLLALLAEIRAAAPHALLLLDAEGGRVDRLRGLFGPAPAGADLARHPPALARRAGRWIGAALRALGFDVDLAPVVDLDRGHSGNALDGRTLGRQPRAVAARAAAFVAGLQRSGVGSCVKHFPGLGGATADTHLRGAPIRLTRAELARDLEPFRRLAARSGAVMIGHASYPALAPAGTPASLAYEIATVLLRRDLGFRGPLLSDDLEMGALDSVGALADRAEAALAAGCDGLLFCRRIEEAQEIAARLGRVRTTERRARAESRLERWRRALARSRELAAPVATPARIRARLADLAAATAG